MIKSVSKDLLIHLPAESHNSNVVFHSNSTFSESLVDLGDKRNWQKLEKLCLHCVID